MISSIILLYLFFVTLLAITPVISLDHNGIAACVRPATYHKFHQISLPICIRIINIQKTLQSNHDNTYVCVIFETIHFSVPYVSINYSNATRNYASRTRY